LTFIALLVLAAMTFIDTQFIFLEKEELIELKEVEREEEIEENAESKKSGFKHLFSGGSDFIASLSKVIFPVYWNNLSLGKQLFSSFHKRNNVPLFIMYCALRVHLV